MCFLCARYKKLAVLSQRPDFNPFSSGNLYFNRVTGEICPDPSEEDAKVMMQMIELLNDIDARHPEERLPGCLPPSPRDP